MEMFIIKKWDLYSYICFLLLLVGGIDLGIAGIIGIDLIHAILGNILSRLVFLGIGGAAGYLIYLIVMERKQAKAG